MYLRRDQGPVTYGNYTNQSGSVTHGFIDPTLSYVGNQGIYDGVVITSDLHYPLWVGNNQVQGGWLNDVLQDQSNSVTFQENNNTYTLSLKGCVVDKPIVSDLANLTIEFENDNRLDDPNDPGRGTSGYILSSNTTAVLTLKGIKGNASSTLFLTNSVGKPAFSGFASLNLDGAYLQKESPLSYNNREMSTQSLTITTETYYPLWFGDDALTGWEQITNDYYPYGELGGRGGPTIYFDPIASQVTIRGDYGGYGAISSGLDDLTVIVGKKSEDTNLAYIRYVNPTGSSTGGNLTIKGEDFVKDGYLKLYGSRSSMYNADLYSCIDGFKTVTIDSLVIFSAATTYDATLMKLVETINNTKTPITGQTLNAIDTNNGAATKTACVTIASVMAPTMINSAGSGNPVLDLTNTNKDYNNNTIGTLKYSVDYVDTNMADIDDAVYDPNNKPEITNAAIVTAYTSFSGLDSKEVTGKYFEFDSLEVETFAGTEFALKKYRTLIPQISPNDNIAINYGVDNAYSAVLEKNTTSGNIMVKGLGLAKVDATLTPQGGANPFTILNPGAKPDFIVSFDVKIVPAAPNILFDGTKQYLNTDSVKITSQDGTKIIYTWSTTTNYNPGDEIDPNNLPSGVFLSDATKSVFVHTTSTGTLTAYTVYELTTSGKYLVGESANHAFSVLKDINQATLPTTWTGSATYEGAAIQPTLTLQDGGTTIDASNYDVSYSDGNNTVSMTNVGAYNIVVTGKGTTYGGTKTIPFTVTQADLNNVDITAIADQTYTGNDLTPTLTVTFNNNAVDAAEYTVSYSKGGNNVTEIKEVGQYTVTLTSTNNNFASGTKKDVTFNIVAATALITANDTTVTYNGAAQAYTNASVDKGSIAIAYYASEADRTADNPMAGAPTNAGTYYIKVTQTDANYTSQAKNATFTIDRAAITSMTLSATQLVYTGGERTVNVDEVKAGNLILAATDYSVSGNKGTAAGTYTVEVKALDTSNFQGTLTEDFTIVNRTLTMNEIDFAQGQTYASYFCNTEDLDLPAGVVAYVVTGVSGNSVTTQAVSYIPKNTAVLLEQNNNAVTTNDNITVNKLVGTTAATDISTITGGEVYVLYNGMFVNSIQGTIPANRCYLKLDQNAGARLYINHDGEDTGIDNILIDETEQWYDLRGRKLQGRPTKKGLYLRNGVKVVVK